MISHLLLPTDFSESGEELVEKITFFQDLGARKVTLLHVRRVSYPTPDSPTEDEYYVWKLKKLATELKEEGWEVRTRCDEGRPALRIAEIAKELNVDVIVMTNHGHGQLKEVMIGSVAMEVLERAKTPVFLHSNDEAAATGQGDTVIHPTDFSASADLALEWVQQLAAANEQRVLLLNARDQGSISTSDNAQKNLEYRRKNLVEGGVKKVETQILEGRPGRVIPETISRTPGALVVMGSHGKGWLGDLLLGSVARRVARRGTHHVLLTPSSEV